MNFTGIDDKFLTLILGFIIGILPSIYKIIRRERRDKVGIQQSFQDYQVDMIKQLSEEEAKMRNALIAQIEGMKQEIKELKNENQKLFKENEDLRKRIFDLEITMKKEATKKKIPKIKK